MGDAGISSSVHAEPRHTLNRDHIAADAIGSLSTLREELWTRMRAEILERSPSALEVLAAAEFTLDLDLFNAATSSAASCG